MTAKTSPELTEMAFRSAFRPGRVMERKEWDAWVDGRLARLRRAARLEQRYANFRPAKPSPPALPERVRRIRNERPRVCRRDYSSERGYWHPGITSAPPDAAWAQFRKDCRALAALYRSELFRQPVNAAKEHAIAA